MVRGWGRLTSARRGRVDVEVTSADGGTRSLQAPRVVLATGSQALVPSLPGLDDTDGPEATVLTNATLFDLASPPRHLVIMGAGVIGSEMAFAFARLGSRVTLVEMADRVLPASEASASEMVGARLEAAGVRVVTGAQVTSVDPSAGAVRVKAAQEGAASPPALEAADRVLVAVGRRPASRGLGLEDVGVEVDRRGAVPVDRAYRTRAPGVHAIGDLIGGAFTHAAHEQGRRLVRYLSVPVPLLPERDHPSVSFTEPEVGQIGPTLAELQRRWPERLLSVHRVALADTDRGGTMGLSDGFVQLVALRGSGRLLAATVVAPGAAEMMPLLVSAQHRGTSLWRLSRLEVAYPALSQAVRQAADDFVFSSLPRLHLEIGAYARWRWA
ncbi:MAG: NAD(P)/FAD-dependent oxidoreductase [Trueperaceae bacterium]|nr:NAD(P)/FAD-dependent oxidoreductase [Trueperaceae bacterium]